MKHTHNIGEALRKARRACGPSISAKEVDLALAALGHSIQPGRTYSYESGRAAPPRWYIDAVAHIYGVSPGALLGEELQAPESAPSRELRIQNSIPVGAPVSETFEVPVALGAVERLDGYIIARDTGPLQRGDVLIARNDDPQEGQIAIARGAEGEIFVCAWGERPAPLSGVVVEGLISTGVAVCLSRDLGRGLLACIVNPFGLTVLDTERLA